MYIYTQINIQLYHSGKKNATTWKSEFTQRNEEHHQ